MPYFVLPNELQAEAHPHLVEAHSARIVDEAVAR
jgi:hypothetical protein